MDKKKMFAAVAVVAVVALVGFLAVEVHEGNPSAGTPISGAGSSSVSAQANATGLFANSQMAPYSYLISQSPLSPQARAALSGFRLNSSALANGTTEYLLTYVPTGANQTVVLKQGYKLYFIETSFGDDQFGGESSLGDDGYVVVDPAGHIVQ